MAIRAENWRNLYESGGKVISCAQTNPKTSGIEAKIWMDAKLSWHSGNFNGADHPPGALIPCLKALKAYIDVFLARDEPARQER